MVVVEIELVGGNYNLNQFPQLNTSARLTSGRQMVVI